MKPQPKPVRVKDKKYVEFIKSLRCWITNSPNPDPHHAQRSGHGGIATKANDRRCIPLRHDLHVELHNIGAKSFATKYDLNYESIIEALNAVYERMHDESD